MDFARQDKVVGRAKGITKTRLEIPTVVRETTTARTKSWVPTTAKGKAKISLENRIMVRVLVGSWRKMNRDHQISAKVRG